MTYEEIQAALADIAARNSALPGGANASFCAYNNGRCSFGASWHDGRYNGGAYRYGDGDTPAAALTALHDKMAKVDIAREVERHGLMLRAAELGAA